MLANVNNWQKDPKSPGDPTTVCIQGDIQGDIQGLFLTAEAESLLSPSSPNYVRNIFVIKLFF